MKRFSSFEILLILSITVIHLYAAFSDAFNMPNFWFSRDDAYYYFKVAQNITMGLGSTFDGINITNGYHPLWMLVCIPIFYLARFDLILPLRVLLIFIGLLNAGTAVLIYRLVSSSLSRAAGILAASFWAFNLYIHTIVYRPGLETPLAAFFIVLFIWKLSQFESTWRTQPVTLRQLAVLAVISVAVMFSRLDLIFLAFLGGIWIVFRGKPIRFLLPPDALIIFAAMTTSAALRTGIEAYNNHYAASTTLVVILALVVKVASLYFFGAYQHPRESTLWKMIQQTILALSVATVVLAALYVALAQFGVGGNFPRTAFFIDWGLSTALMLALRLTARFLQIGGRKAKVNTESVTPFMELKINWKKWLTDAVTYYGILGGALGLYLAFNQLMFGTSSPVSGQIKRWWGTMNTVYERPAHDWFAFFGLGYKETFDAWRPASNLFLWFGKILYPIYRGADTLDERYYIAILLFVLLAIFLIAFNARYTLLRVTKMGLIPLAAGGGIQILSYTTTAYGGAKEWYWVSQMVFITLAGSLLIELLLRVVTAKLKFPKITFELAAVALALFMAYGLGNNIKTTMPYSLSPKGRPYLDAIRFLEENTSPGSIIGMTGGGTTGYFIQDRTIINMDGLINSNEYFTALQNRTAPEYLRQHGMQIIFANVQTLELPPYFGQFAPYVEKFGDYGGKNLVYLLNKPKY